MNETTDYRYLHRALDLAGKGIGLASPNPCVGAVILDRNGEVAGSGWHEYAKLDHAEIVALREAGGRAEGGTLYINLEPCSHHGRTPPCADAVIAAKIARVVAAMPDPNPKVAGSGFAKLRDAGIHVDVLGEVQVIGRPFFEELRREARRLNESFTKYIRTGLPFVTLKAGMSLDGKIASKPNTREQITGAQSQAVVQELRHASDAILVGIGTVLADDPLLTDRSGKARRRPLLRAIVDSNLRLPLDSQLVRTSKEDLIVFCTSADASKRKELESKGVTIVQIESEGNHVNLTLVFEHLGKRQITSVLLEGGAAINGAALASGLVDKAFLFVAPKIIGGSESVPLISSGRLDDVLHLQHTRVRACDKDFAVEGYFRDVYA